MALPWILANLTAGNQPLSKLDDNFNALGAISMIPCTAAGTNAITLTPAALTPSVAAYGQLQAYRAVAVATLSGAGTAQVGALGFLNAYKPSASGPVQIGAGDIVIGECYDFVYDVALDTGAGGFHVYNVFTPLPSVSRFSANKNGTNQTGIVSGAVTLVTFGTEAYDVGGTYNSGASTWTPTSGLWLTTALVEVTAGIVDQSQYQLELVKDPLGSPVNVATSVGQASGTGPLSLIISTQIAATGSDAYGILFLGFGAGNKTILGTIAATYWQAVKFINT